MKLITLYRPVGQKELDLIKESGFKKFPPRLEWQPIFYPVINQEYAIQIAREWNTNDANSGYAGYVTAFDLAEEYLTRYPIQNVGAAIHNELWVPAEELEDFNSQIIGPIRIIDSFFGEKYLGSEKRYIVMNYSLSWLKDQLKSHHSFEYLFFWGHSQKNPAKIGKSCLSQWYPSPITVEGIHYSNAEQWMMAQKALLFKDEPMHRQILDCTDAATVKKLGRAISNFNAGIWEQHAYSIVKAGNLHKFSQNESLKDFLLQTGEQVIVEASPADAIWGIGLPASAAVAKDPFQWRGTNLLGFALMEVRDKI